MESKALRKIDSNYTGSSRIVENSSHENFEAIISEVEDYAIILLDLRGTITTWNKGAERIKGYQASEIIGKSFKVFYPKEDYEQGLPDLLLEQARTNGKATHEGWRLKKSGYRFWGNVTITALHDDGGHVIGFLKLTKDLTDRKIAEDRYNNLFEELRFKNEELKREEERYQKMFSEVQDYAIISLDTEGKVLDWNKGAEHLKGYKASEIIGKNFRTFYPKEDREDGVPDRLLKEAAHIGSVNHEGYRVKKDGSRFWAGVTITALHGEGGNVIGFSKVTKDLTDRKAAEDRLAVFARDLQQANEELRLSEERYQKMVSEVRDYAIILLNADGEILNWNTGAELIKGYTSREIVGKSFRLFYQKEDLERGLPDELLHEARITGRASNEGWRQRKDGSGFWASVVITALHNTSGQVIGFSKVTRDLTDRKAAEDALRDNSLQLQIKNQELEKLNTELSSFAYVVSHDFKEPIRKIQVFAGRQKEPDKTLEQIVEFSDKIISSARRMQSLMESLLSYSRISNDNSPAETVDLNEILQIVRSDLELLIEDNAASVQAATLPEIIGVPFQLHQLFVNLITNSIKYQHPDRKPHIVISCEKVAPVHLPRELSVKSMAYYRITFADNGIGFDPSQSEKIFDVFRRLRPNDNQGTGIGLAIVRKVALNHNGFVFADAEPGMGAKFHVFFPVQ